MVAHIEAEIQSRGGTEISSKDIGELCGVDEIARVRFASVYRRFQDKAEFLEELKKLLR